MGGKLAALAKDTAIFAVGSGTSKLILFLLLPLYTYCMTTDSYGTAELICNMLQMVFPIASLCVIESVFRFAIDQTEESDEVFRIGVLTVVASVLAVSIACCCIEAFTDFGYALDFIVLYSAYAFSQLFKNYIRGLGHVRLFAISGVINAIVIALMSILLLIVFDAGIHGYLVAFASGYAVEAVIVVVADWSDLPWLGKVSLTTLKACFRFSLPAVPNMASWWFTNVSTRYIVSWFLGVGTAGLYTAACKFSAVVNLMTDVFQKAWQYSSSLEIDGDDEAYFSEAFRAYFSILIISTSLAVTLTPFICGIALSEAFREAWVYVPFLMIAASVNGLSKFFGSFYTAAKNNVMAMVSTIIGAAVNVIGWLVLIPFLGVSGAIISTLAAYTVISVFRMIDTKKYVKVDADPCNMLIQMGLLLFQGIVLVASSGSILLSGLLTLALVFMNRDVITLLIRGKKV